MMRIYLMSIFLVAVALVGHSAARPPTISEQYDYDAGIPYPSDVTDPVVNLCPKCGKAMGGYNCPHCVSDTRKESKGNGGDYNINALNALERLQRKISDLERRIKKLEAQLESKNRIIEYMEEDINSGRANVPLQEPKPAVRRAIMPIKRAY